MQAGDALLVVSDGFPESRSPDDEFFGIERTLSCGRSNHADSAQAIVDALFREVLEFADGRPQQDDMTVVVVKRNRPSLDRNSA